MNTPFDKFKSLFTNIISPAFHECIRSAPDSLFLGSILLSVLTQSFPLIVLSLAMGEIGLIQRFLASILDSISGNLKTQGPEICRMGIPSPYQISAVGNLIKEYAFPNGTLFFLSATIVYISLSIMNYEEELTNISITPEGQNHAWKSRVTLSIIFSGLLIAVFLLYNVLYECVTVIPAFGSVMLGSLIGLFVFLINSYLFGRESINFLGIPMLVENKIVYAEVPK
jgi:hypothetical protein